MTKAVLNPTASSNANTNASVGFLQHNNGNNSSICLTCFVFLITAIILGSYTPSNSKTVVF